MLDGERWAEMIYAGGYDVLGFFSVVVMRTDVLRMRFRIWGWRVDECGGE